MSDYSITANDLTFFWFNVYPRVIGKLWQDQYQWAQNGSQSPSPVDELREHPDRLLSYVCRLNDPSYEPLIEKLDANNFWRTARFIEEDAYDYLLSSAGISLPIPPAPSFVDGDNGDTMTDIFRKFSYRESTSPSLRLPLFTPPSSLRPGNRTNGTSRESICDKVKAREEKKAPAPAPNNGPDTASAEHNRVREFLKNRKMPVVEAYRFFLLSPELGAPNATWTLSGFEINRLLDQLPHIIATAWYDDEQETDTEYKRAFIDEEGPSPQAKSIITERLELSVEYVRDLAITISHAQEEQKRDHVFTSDGITVYVPPRPELNVLLGEWAAGTASNPIFTPSGRCAI